MIASEQRLDMCIGEAIPLIENHWRELYPNEPYSSDYDGMIQMQNNGGMAYYTLRDEAGELAGHAGFFVINSPVYRCKVAIDSFFYILPKFRGRLGTSKLIKFAAKDMIEKGVSSVSIGIKNGMNLAPIVRRGGYVQTGEIFSFVR